MAASVFTAFGDLTNRVKTLENASSGSGSGGGAEGGGSSGTFSTPTKIELSLATTDDIAITNATNGYIGIFPANTASTEVEKTINLNVKTGLDVDGAVLRLFHNGQTSTGTPAASSYKVIITKSTPVDGAAIVSTVRFTFLPGEAYTLVNANGTWLQIPGILPGFKTGDPSTATTPQ